MPLSGLHHVLVLTDDLEGTRDFYCEVLGLEVGERPPLPFPGCWLYLEDVPCVHVADREAYDAHAAGLGLSESTAPVDHLAFAAEDYRQLVARLEAAGVEAVTNAVPGSGIHQLFFDDPNGQRIELVVRE